MKQFKTTLILGVVLAVLAGIAYWDEQKTKKEEHENEQKNRLLTLKPDEVVELIYESQELGDNQQIVVKKINDHWEITSPIHAAADDGIMKTFLKSLTEYKYSEIITADSKRWHEFGLDKPQKVITLKTKDQNEQRLFIGNKAPIGYSVYLRKNDDPNIYFGSQYILTAASKSLKDFRDKKILNIDTNQLVSISYARVQQKPILITRQEGQWQIKAPEPLEASQDAVAELVDALAEMRAEDFVDLPDQSLQKALTNKPVLKVSLEFNDHKKLTLYFAELEGSFFVSSQPEKIAYVINESLKDNLMKTLFDLRDRRLIRYPSEQVRQVVIDQEAYVREKDSWYKSSDAARSQPQDFIQSLVVDLEFAKVTDYISPNKLKKLMKKKPEHELALTVNLPDKKEHTVRLQMWPDDNESSKVYVKSSDQPEHILQTEASHFVNMKPETKEDGASSALKDQKEKPQQAKPKG